MARARVLLADDHEGVLARVSGILEDQYDIVGLARNGDSALAMASALDPDIVVLDISMPRMSGIDVARQLRDIGARAKTLFLTVHAGEDYVSEALGTGARGYVLKSCLASDLVTAIRNVLADQFFVSPAADVHLSGSRLS